MHEANAGIRTSQRIHGVTAPAPTDTERPVRTTVSKEFAHLRNDTTVLVTGWRRSGPDEFLLTAQWPASTSADHWPYDPRVLAQAIRQGGLVIAHAEYGVPLTHQTLLNHLDYTVSQGFRVPRDRPLPMEIRVRPRPAQRRGRAARSLTVDVDIRHDGITTVRSDSAFGWISPAAYQRLRGPRLTVDWGNWPVPAPVAPEIVGRSSPTDVLLAPGGRRHRWQLRHDVSNTLLYDHPVDHVPGLVLLETAHQAAHATVGPPVEITAIASSYSRYVEFDAPCWIEATALPEPGAGRFRVLVTGTQDGETAFRIELSGVRG